MASCPSTSNLNPERSDADAALATTRPNDVAFASAVANAASGACGTGGGKLAHPAVHVTKNKSHNLPRTTFAMRADDTGHGDTARLPNIVLLCCSTMARSWQNGV
jgi:hypothetical protein